MNAAETVQSTEKRLITFILRSFFGWCDGKRYIILYRRKEKKQTESFSKKEEKRGKGLLKRDSAASFFDFRIFFRCSLDSGTFIVYSIAKPA